MLKKDNLALYAFRKYGDNALRAAYCCTGNRPAAERAAAAVFCKLRREPPVLSDDSALKAWVLRNVIEFCDAPDTAAALTGKPDDALQRRLASLPPHCGEIVYLHDYEHYSVAEIAELLRRPEHTVAAQLADGRRGSETAEGDCA
ncbi:MAG: hypothetical protein IKQ39_00820 [Oscillospiraceae bacterium]|nr:hypothetical protein [Oscillospiraceae bacterium]